MISPLTSDTNSRGTYCLRMTTKKTSKFGNAVRSPRDHFCIKIGTLRRQCRGCAKNSGVCKIVTCGVSAG